MITLIVIVAVVWCWAVITAVREGCSSLRQLCAELERDRRGEYRYPVPPSGRRTPQTAHRRCPDWLRRARA